MITLNTVNNAFQLDVGSTLLTCCIIRSTTLHCTPTRSVLILQWIDASSIQRNGLIDGYASTVTKSWHTYHDQVTVLPAETSKNVVVPIFFFQV